MSCKICKNIIEIANDDIPHVIRKCQECGREMRIQERGEHGIGIKIKKGDKFIIPQNFLKIHANPLKGSSQLTKHGLAWFAKLLFLEELPNKEDDFEKELEKIDNQCDDILRNSDLLKELDIENPDHHPQIFEILKKSNESAEWWASLVGLFINLTKKAIEEKNPQKTAWAMACAERSRSMLVFKQELEEVVLMGHSARRIVDILREWDSNKENADEEFWQIKFNQHSYVLSQVFSVPVVFIQDKAYVGGMTIDRKDAKFVDYLFSGTTNNEIILIEIKTPKTKLLGAKYRKVYKPSAELSGTLVQISDYKNSLTQNLSSITQNLDKGLTAFNPRCLIIAGNGERELDNDVKRRSFELYRSSLQNIEIITYDELFKKIEILATLFGLIRKKTEPGVAH